MWVSCMLVSMRYSESFYLALVLLGSLRGMSPLILPRLRFTFVALEPMESNETGGTNDELNQLY